ncbi:c-type cytochrome (plasmid) [Rhizorhabdus wittichii]|uniref:C-type cytochrome n=2 Tax=Rhizorhabdus wittichii TaxID=160791 RepID=A0A975D8D6_9SPHN|nr:c-type cytochrome [Rhizorhabdus wittichii]
MRKLSKVALTIGSGTALSAAMVLTISAPAAGSASPSPQRPASFLQCAACHSVDPGRNGVGPSLAGVAGRKAASLPTFNYSAALKNSGLTWDAASLDRWLTSPQRTVPGTKMPFAGIPDPAKRKEVVDYLMTLK